MAAWLAGRKRLTCCTPERQAGRPSSQRAGQPARATEMQYAMYVKLCFQLENRAHVCSTTSSNILDGWPSSCPLVCPTPRPARQPVGSWVGMSPDSKLVSQPTNQKASHRAIQASNKTKLSICYVCKTVVLVGESNSLRMPRAQGLSLGPGAQANHASRHYDDTC